MERRAFRAVKGLYRFSTQLLGWPFQLRNPGHFRTYMDPEWLVRWERRLVMAGQMPQTEPLPD